MVRNLILNVRRHATMPLIRLSIEGSIAVSFKTFETNFNLISSKHFITFLKLQ